MASDSKPSKENSSVHLWLVLWRAYDAVRAYAYADITKCELGLTDFAILELLLHKGPTPVNAIGAKVLLTSGSITVAVDRLVARNLVQRRGDEKDRRARVVYLTEDGTRIITEAFKAHAASMRKLTDECLSRQETEQLAVLLKKLGKKAKQLTSEEEETSG
jgi:MarR family 2-MHQ and catechol resistance regulon transcriptional repressor